MFLAALLVMSKNCKKLKHPSTTNWKNKQVWSTYIVVYYEAVNMNELMVHVDESQNNYAELN